MWGLLVGIHNQSFFDSYWVGVHFASGLAIGFLVSHYLAEHPIISPRRYWRYGFSLLLLWEYFELSLRYIQKYDLRIEHYLQVIVPDSFFSSESIINIISDLVVGSIALALIYLYRSRGREA